MKLEGSQLKCKEMDVTDMGVARFGHLLRQRGGVRRHAVKKA